MPLTFASIFSGCGGFDLGFVQAGYRSIGAFDNDVDAVSSHRTNLKSGAQLCDLAASPHVVSGLKPDVLLAGPPCQGFSTVGKREIHDPRNSLLVLAGEIAIRLKPKIFVLENVSGVVSGEHGKYWATLGALLRGGGYSTKDVACDASTLGVPQRRKRMFMVAWRSDTRIELALPVVDGGTVAGALTGLRGLSHHYPQRLDPKSDSGRIAQRIRQGQKLSNVRAGSRSVHTWHVPEVYGRTTAAERRVLDTVVRLRRRNRSRDYGDADPTTVSAISAAVGHSTRRIVASLIRKGYMRQFGQFVDITHTFNGKYRRLDPDKPSPTVDTHFGDPRLFLHPKYNRGLTVREAARFQGFPDWFVFHGSRRSQYRLVGNAVPPPMARHLADCLTRTLLNRTIVFNG